MKTKEFNRKWKGIFYPDYLKGWKCTGCSLNQPYIGFACEHVEIDGKAYSFNVTIEHNRFGRCEGQLFRGINNIHARGDDGVECDWDAALDLLDRHFTTVKASATQV